MSIVSVQNLSFTIENENILRKFSYEFPDNLITGVLAPVEEHISYLLKIICGISEPTEGTVLIGGIDLFNDAEDRITEIRKKIGFCFARGGLLSNLSILENILLPFDFHYPHMPVEQKKEKILAIFRMLDIHDEVLTHRPAKLHPQMYKMILLVRAFVLEPAIILYDNPFLELELHYRKLVYKYMHYLRDEKSTTQIFVSTSDILFEIADQILVFNHGYLVETGDWNELLVNGKETTHMLIKQYLEAGIGTI